MNVGAGEILVLGSLAILAYFFISEVIKQTREKDWTLVIILSSIIALGLIFLAVSFYNRRNKSEEIIEDIEDQETDLAIEDDFEQLNHTILDEETMIKDDFNQLPNVQIEIGQPVEPEVDQMNYMKFKELCFTKPFLTQMMDALKLSLKTKHDMYIKFRKKLNIEIKTFGKQEEGLRGIISNMRNETFQAVKSALDEVNKLLKEIPSRLKLLNMSSVSRGLRLALFDSVNGLEKIIGRNEIKDFLALRLYSFSKNPKVFMSTFQHMAIYAPSGYGKTKIATTIGHVYASVGLLFRGNVISMTKSNIVSPFVNETSQKTKTLLLSTLESVVFMDEAYDITPPRSLMGPGLDHGHEAITEIVNFTDKTIGMNLIIVAGYEDEMKERFMQANQGLARRFPHEIRLLSYNSKELTSILVVFLRETNPDLKLDKEIINYIYTLIAHICNEQADLFDKQAGAMQNLAAEISHSMLGSEQGCTKAVIRTGFNKFLSNLGVGITEHN